MNNLFLPDILFIEIKRRIEQFYNEEFFGIDNEERKKAHLQLLETYYDAELFSDPNAMKENLNDFLTVLHNVIEKLFND